MGFFPSDKKDKHKKFHIKLFFFLFFLVLTEQNYQLSTQLYRKHTFIWCITHHISYNLTYSLFSHMGFFVMSALNGKLIFSSCYSFPVNDNEAMQLKLQIRLNNPYVLIMLEDNVHF